MGGVPTDFQALDQIVGLAAQRRLALLPVVMFTPVTTSGWAYTCPSTCTWKSFPNVDELTLLGVNCVSLGLLPVLVGPS